MAPRSPMRSLVLLAGACMCLRMLAPCFVPAPQQAPQQAGVVNANVAMSAALPVLTMLADDAEAKYGDSRRWSAILVPLTTLIFPGVLFGSFVLYAFSEDKFWQLLPGSKKSEAYQARFREHPLFENTEDPMNGLIDKDDFEKGFAEAWEKAKPAGCTITAEEKLKELSEQNNPHWWKNKVNKALSA